MRTAIAFALAFASAPVGAASLHFSAGPDRVTLIELYTSEGCNGCPQADHWLASFRGRAELWKQVVPVEFHVTAWDSLGWKDPLASNKFTARQDAYINQWAGSQYTPCFARNGIEWRPSWGGVNGPGPNVGYLLLAVEDNGKCTAEFRVGPAATKFGDGYYVAHVALLGGGISSHVLAGENSGKTLEHEFAVLGIADARLMPIFGFTTHRATFALPRANPAAATRRAVAAWVTLQGDMVPIQSVGGWLP